MFNHTSTCQKVLLLGLTTGLVAGLFAALSACQVASPVPPQPGEAPAALALTPGAATPAGGPSLDAAASLASLKQVGDLPFYTMTLVGDYGFSPHLQARQSSRPSQASPWGCTVFTAQTPAGERLLARNFDWYVHPALLLFTHPPAGYASASMVDISYLGFDQAITDWRPPALEPLLRAPYLPFDGLNAAGLAVGMMAVPHADGGNDPGKVTLDSLEVIRLLLDRAADVDEALDLLEQVNVDFGDGPPLHYLLADRAGNSAVVEYLDGQPQVLRSPLAWQVSTNFLLAEAQPNGADSACWRYNTATTSLEQAQGILETDQALGLLQQVSQSSGSPTQWSVVYNQSSGAIQVVIRREYNQVHTFQLR